MKEVWGAPDSEFVTKNLTEEEKVSLKFLDDLDHKITIAPLFCFYISIKRKEEIAKYCPDYLEKLDKDDQLEFEKDYQKGINDFKSALLATSAFSIIWRTAWGSVNDIQKIYRNITKTYLSFNARQEATKSNMLSEYKRELLDILKRKIPIKEKNLYESWLERSEQNPICARASVVAKILVYLAADCAVITEENKLDTDKKNNPCLLRGEATNTTMTLDSWKIDTNIEHIAPKRGKDYTLLEEWEAKKAIYRQPDHNVNLLGNLLIVPRDINQQALTNCSWIDKRAMYRYIGNDFNLPKDKSSKDYYAVVRIIKEITKLDNTKLEKFIGTGFCTLCRAVGMHEDEWEIGSIEKRTSVLLDIAWGRISPWLIDSKDKVANSNGVNVD